MKLLGIAKEVVGCGDEVEVVEVRLKGLGSCWMRLKRVVKVLDEAGRGYEDAGKVQQEPRVLGTRVRGSEGREGSTTQALLHCR